MKNLWTTILVKDMDASVRFYTEVLGLPLHQRYSPTPGMEITFLGDGETHFEMIHRKGVEVNHSSAVSTGFQIESVDKMINKLKTNGIEILDEPVSPTPHITFFHVLDPNGYKIQLVELKSI